MAYRAILNNSILFFDSSKQYEKILLTKAVVEIRANSSGSFNFTMAASHRSYNTLRRLVDLIDVYRDDDLIFTGRVFSISKPLDGMQTVKCEGLLSMLNDSVYRPKTYQGDLEGLVLDLIASHNDQVEVNKKFYLRNFTIQNSDVYRDYINYEQTITRLKDLQASFGGYLMVKKNYDAERASIVDVNLIDVGIVDVGDQQIYLDWLEDFTDACEQQVKLTSNLLNIEKTIDADGIITGIVPIGAKNDDGSRVTIESVNYGSDLLLADSEYIAKYGYIIKAVIWDDVHEPGILKTKAAQYLAAALTERTEIKLTAVDLADAGVDIESFRVGQKITVTSLPHDINAVQFNCVSQTLDLLNPAQNRLELGETKVGYVQSVKSNSEQILVAISQDIARSETTLRAVIDQATAMITGNEGGYVVFHDGDGDEFPDEILIMDSPAINTAVKVWRWNQAGLGYSSHGYNGLYGLAITMDGGINADYVAVGTMLADRIRGGTLQLGGYDNQSGLLQVMDASGNVVVKADKDGLESTVLTATQYIFVDGNNRSKIKIPLSANDNQYFFQISSEGFLLNSSIGKIYTALRSYSQSGKPEPPRDTYGLTEWSKADGSGYMWTADLQPGILSAKKGTGTYDSYFSTVASTNIFPAYMELVGNGSQFTVDPENKKFYYKAKNAGSLEYISSTNTWQMNNANLVVGSSKSRVVETEDYNKRLLYCYEMASPMFGDVGEGIIGDDGLCYVMMDPILTETIVTEQYQVFLQPYGDGRCWIRERNSGNFIVEGTPGLSFGWELKAKQSNFDQLRLASPDERIVPTGVEAEVFSPGQPDYAAELYGHINKIIRDREVIIA